MRIKKIENLICSVCGNFTKGRQWYNRDTGYGLCSECATWIKDKTDTNILLDSYGREGEHYLIKGQDEKIYQ